MVEIDEQIAIERLISQIRDYAKDRARNVARGAETPRLAALLIQKYGRGMVDAMTTILDAPRIADPVSRVVDEETEKIDPLWRKHDQERWASRPADVQ